MATKKPDEKKYEKKPKPAPQPKPEHKKPVKTQMEGGESGDDNLGYDPAVIPTEDIPD